MATLPAGTGLSFSSNKPRLTLRLAFRPMTRNEAVSTNLYFNCGPPEAGRPGLKGALTSLNTTPSRLLERRSS